jgi:hypothetical protein
MPTKSGQSGGSPSPLLKAIATIAAISIILKKDVYIGM